MWTWLLGTSTVPLGAAFAATIEKLTSVIEEAFADTHLPMPPSSTPLLAPRCSARRMGGCMRVSQASGLHEKWNVRLRGAYSISHSTLGLREKDQSCHHEVWMHLPLTDPRRDYAPWDEHDQRLHLKERSAPSQRNKGRSRALG